MARKTTPLDGFTITFSGHFPSTTHEKLQRRIEKLGGTTALKVNAHTTILIASFGKYSTNAVKVTAATQNHIPIVSLEWLEDIELLYVKTETHHPDDAIKPATSKISLRADSVPSRSIRLHGHVTKTSGAKNQQSLMKEKLVSDTGWKDVGDSFLEYQDEIDHYMRELEIGTMANPDYMNRQKGLERSMRGQLMDWLIHVHELFRLLPKTLYLAVNIIDRFLSTATVLSKHLKLIGIASLMIAAKYEERLGHRHVDKFCQMANGAYTNEQLLLAERDILASIDYNLSYSSPVYFFHQISQANNYNNTTLDLGRYLLEISCLDDRFIGQLPSQIAAAAMYLARLIERGEWDTAQCQSAGLTLEQVWPVLQLMVSHILDPVVHRSLFDKYAKKELSKASIVLRLWMKTNWQRHCDRAWGDNVTLLT